MPRAVVTILVRGGRGVLAQLQGVTREVRSVAQAEARAEASHARMAKSQAASAAEKAATLRAQAKLATEQRRQITAANAKADQDRRAQSEQTDKEFTAAEKRKAKAAEEAAKREAKAAERAARQSEAAAKRAAREQEREAKRLAREQERAAQKALRAREKAEREATRAARREAAKRERIDQQTLASRRKHAADMLRRGGGLLGVAGAGVLAGGATAMSSARSTLGVQDAMTRVQQANLFKEQLVITGIDAGLSDAEIKQAEEKISAASKAAVMPQLEIMSGLSIAHERFNALKPFLDNIENIAMAAKASKTPMEDFIGMLGAAQTAYGLNAEQLNEAMDIMLAGAMTGAIAPKDFAGPMASAMGSHALNTGQTGIQGVRQFVALMQTVGAGQFGASESETRATQFVAMLSRADISKKLQGIGVKVRDESGKIDIGSVVEQLATNERFQTPTQRQAIFRDKESREGIETLIAQRRKALSGDSSAVDFASMVAVDRAIGARSTADKIDRLESTGLLNLQRKAIEMQDDTIRNLDKYNKQLLAVVDVSNRLEKAFGSLAMWANAIGALGLASSGVSLFGKVFGRGAAAAAGAGTAATAGTAAAGTAAAGAAGGGLLATLGTGVASLGAGAIAAGVAAGGAIGAGLGWGINEITEAGFGESLSDMLANWFVDDDLQASRGPREGQNVGDGSHRRDEGQRQQAAQKARTDTKEAQRERDVARISQEIATSAPTGAKTAAEKAADEKPSKVDLRVDLHQYDHRTQVKTSVKSPNNVNVSTLSGPTPFGGL